jgi:Tol biopolymer transport system component
MNPDRNVNDTIERWVGQGADHAPEQFVWAALDELEQTPQRDRVRYDRMPIRWEWLATALLLAGVIGGAVLIGSGRLRLPIVLVPPSAQPSPSTSEDEASFRLAYISDGDVYLADWDGGNPVLIADGPPGDSCESYSVEGSMWSPDGRYVAYRSGCWGDSPGHPAQDVTGTVHVSDAAGRAVTSFPGEGWRVSWSPDSARIATWDNFEETVAIFGLDGVREAHLTLPEGFMADAPLGDYDPPWSPDGTALLFPPFEVPVDGTGIRRLPDDDPLSTYGAIASPDGTQIAYVAYGSLRIADVDGSHAQTLIRSDAPGAPSLFGIVWSPGGDRIAFGNVSAADGGLGDELQVVDILTGSVTTLPDDGEFVYPMGFSPGGDRVLFASRSEDRSDLWSIDTDGSNAQLLVTGVQWGSWQPSPEAPVDCNFPPNTLLAFAGISSLRELGLPEPPPGGSIASDQRGHIYVTADRVQLFEDRAYRYYCFVVGTPSRGPIPGVGVVGFDKVPDTWEPPTDSR